MSNESLKQINRSGYPFQLAIEYGITETCLEHGWSVASREHPWTSPARGMSGYIDIVLQHSELVTARLILECKRIKADDSRQLRWVFLAPEDQPGKTPVATCFELEGRGSVIESGAYAGTFEWRDRRIWDNVRVTPESPQAEFCIMNSNEPARQPLLERLASELLESIEGLAEEEVLVKKSVKERHLRLFIFPVIVTNAELVVGRFNSGNISISDGTLEETDVGFEVVPYLRFRKSLTSDFPDGEFNGLGSARRARDRTVFVVNSLKITEFLKGWGFRAMRDKFAIQKLGS